MKSQTTNGGRLLLALGLLMTIALQMPVAYAAEGYQPQFKRVPTQYIAALGDPDATSGNNAQTWGLWTLDPGPRGVPLKSFEQLQAAGGLAPAKWQFDSQDWWLEENGRIMEPPQFPLPPGKYIVTGYREKSAVLTVHPSDEDGNRRWELNRDANLYDVTHLGCRSARYTPAAGENSCSPARASSSDFRVSAGDPMPPVPGCSKQDYHVLVVVAVAADS